MLEFYDIESLINLFTYTGYNNGVYKQFVISKWRNDAEELYAHLYNLYEKNIYMVGFNNINYDYPVIHHFLRHYKYEYKDLNGEQLASRLYQKSQEIINQEFSAISEANTLINQLDLYRIHHFNNKARSCSLKQIEFNLELDNVEDMPISHTTWCKEGDENLILSYNKHDVYTTYLFWQVTIGNTEHTVYKGKNKMQLRKDIYKTYGINCFNKADVPMGEELLLSLYSKITGRSKYDLKNCGGTKRPIIKLSECIPHWFNPTNKQFKDFKDSISKIKIKPYSDNKNDKSFSKSVIYNQFKFDFGLGGSHGCIEPGIYTSDEQYIILDMDVASLYPSIAKELNLYPEHLGKEFIKIYSDFIAQRLAEKAKPKAIRKFVIVEGLKLVLNGAYGKSNEPSSFLYDPLYTYKTTIAGQCFISLWSEKIVEYCKDVTFIQVNTDGITIRIPKNNLNKAYEACDYMTKLTGLEIEYALYDKMIIRDVNNYIAVYQGSTRENEQIKLKGAFEIDKEFHKDSSMKIVPMALKEYFVYGTDYKKYILNHNKILDFSLFTKMNRGFELTYNYLDKKDDWKFKTIKLGKNTRYLITNDGGGLEKIKKDNNYKSGLNVGYYTTIINKFDKTKNYDINYSFYIKEVLKIIEVIQMKPLKLF